jgi:hypothetical protein
VSPNSPEKTCGAETEAYKPGALASGSARGKLAERRQNLLKLLAKRFPGAVPDDVVRLVNEQESLDVLGHWFDDAAEAYTFQQFMDVLKR